MVRWIWIAVVAIGAAAQTPAGFEAASIKASSPSAPRPGRMGAPVDTSPGSLTARNATLKQLIEGAYGVDDYQVLGGPGWLDSARFDVEAKAAGRANRDQLLEMLRSLLTDRFKLAIHRERKELAVYAMVVAKDGPKFHALPAGAASTLGKTNHLRSKNLSFLVRYLTHFGSDKPVIDQTGLTGSFDIDLDLSKVLEEASQSGAGGPEQMFEATLNAIEDQLGLKLVPRKAPVEIYIIDHAERASAN